MVNLKKRENMNMGIFGKLFGGSNPKASEETPRETKIMLANRYGEQARKYADRGKNDKAMELYKAQERIYREVGHDYNLALCLLNQTFVMANMRAPADTITDMSLEAHTIAQRVGDPELLKRTKEVALIALKPGR